MRKKNLSLKESARVKYKDRVCADLCLKLYFENDWYFCDITESRWFWKRLSRNKETPVLESLSNKVAGLKADNFIKRKL